MMYLVWLCRFSFVVASGILSWLSEWNDHWIGGLA